MHARSLALGGLLALTGVAVLGAMFAPAPATPTEWDWLEDACWYVPPRGLPNQV